MYLKYVEIYGFKSFANKVKIEFFPGVNIIVGPNGCGKSNIVDAIKWSVGEMSRKALRMPSMTDVIFAGTTKRSSMNFAEVTLVFDNSERKLPIQFDEVAVTRKIYRSEESEYFINRVPCRLKDIKELFLDTGIGTNGYAIIDQGEIEEILLADPFERREVFEEVAGISRYKAKRDETLLKLEKVSYDLSIVENSVSLIEQQIKKLENEAKKAKLQQQYQSELREYEIAMTVKNIIELYSKIDEENKNLEPIIKEINEVNTDLIQIETETSKKDLELTQKVDLNKELSERIVSIKLEISHIEGEITKNQHIIEEIRSRIHMISENYEKNKNIKNETLPKIDIIKQNVDLLRNEFSILESKYLLLVSEYNEIESKYNELGKKIEERENKIVEQYQKEINLSNNLAKFESDLSHISEDIASICREKEKLENQMRSIVSDIENINAQILSFTNKKDELQKELLQVIEAKKQMESQKNNLESEISNIDIEIASLSSRYSALEKDAQRDSYWRGTKAVVDSKIDGVYGVMRNLIKFKGLNNVVLEDMLGEYIDCVVVKDRETAIQCIEYLRNNNIGRAKFIDISSVPILSPESPVVNEFFEVEDDRIRNFLNHVLSRVVVNNTVVVSDFWLCGGTDNATSNEPYWSELDEIKNKIETLRNIRNEKDAMSKHFSLVLNENNERIGILEKEIKEIDTAISKLSFELHSADEKKRVLEENLRFLIDEIKKLDEEKGGLLGRISELKSELDMVKLDGLNMRNEVENLKAERNDIGKKLIDKKEEMTLSKHKMDMLLSEIERLNTELNSLERLVNDINNNETEYVSSRQELEERIKKLENDISLLRVKREEMSNDLGELEIERAKLEKDIIELKEYISHLHVNLKESNEVLKELLNKKSEIDLKINTYNTKIEDLQKKLEMEYLVSYNDVKEKYAAYEVDEKRVEYLKKRIENMGPINMAAPAEYDELMKEYEDKKKQIDDLKKAKADLKEAISKINQTTKENLKSTFEKVNEHFKKIYLTLFDGGNANLIFTDPDNILESGIEIMACPPGKRLVNISQLSGGEKSLTAVALLFSFFCVNPSPFCVMDEVDAALDESNIERFCNLLKSFSSTTQFIVITHNKRTIESGNKIYGVTMEEQGVSKVLSVDLKRAEDMINSRVSL